MITETTPSIAPIFLAVQFQAQGRARSYAGREKSRGGQNGRIEMNDDNLPKFRFPSHLMANAMRRELEALNGFMLGRESIDITQRYFEAVYRYYGERIEKLEIALAEAQKRK